MFSFFLCIYNKMKTCYKCKTEKPFTEFNRDRNIIDGYQRICRSCKQPMDNNYSQNNKDVIKKNNHKRFQLIKNAIQEFKSKYFCVKCKESRWYLLDFHHLDPSIKEHTISNLFREEYSNKEKIEREAAKCITLCSNCHREFHHLEHNQNYTIQQYLKTIKI